MTATKTKNRELSELNRPRVQLRHQYLGAVKNLVEFKRTPYSTYEARCIENLSGMSESSISANCDIWKWYNNDLKEKKDAVHRLSAKLKEIKLEYKRLQREHQKR